MEKLRPRFHDEAGLSLVEVMVAVLVLGIVLGAMAQSLTTSLFGVQRQERQTQATAQLQESLEVVQGVRWEDAGLCESPALAHFGGGTYTYPDATTEPLVLLDDSDATCSGTPVIQPSRVVTREGNAYTVETVISWADDPSDDVAGSDPNTTQDLKHVQVTISWDVRGEATSVRSETYLAPNALEQPIKTLVTHLSGATYTYLDTATGQTQTDVILRVFTVVPQSGVTVAYLNRTGGSVGPAAMTPVGGSGTEFEFVIQNGSPGTGFNEMANGETLFRFRATDSATGTTATVLDRGLFLIEQSGHQVTSSSLPAAIRLKDGVACDFSVEITVAGALTSDLVAATWTNGPTETALSATATSPTGATFRATFVDATTFASGTTTVTLRANRVADGHAAELVADIPVVELEEAATC